MEKTNYKKAGSYYLVGNLFNKGFSFLTIPIFTRILSTLDYGIVTTYNSWVAIMSLIIGSALYMGVRLAFINYGDKIDDFMAVFTTFVLLSGGGICLLSAIGNLVLKINVNYILIMCCILQGLSAALLQNFSMYLMMQYRYKFRTALMIFPELISAVVSVIVIFFALKTNLYMGRIIPVVLINLGFGIFTVGCVYNKSRMFFNKEYLKYGLGVSAPLILHGIALNILAQSDRMMITWLADASQTGIYSLIYNFGMVATVITASLDGIWVPWFYEKLKQRDIHNINILAKDYINLMTYAMIGIILVGPEIVKVLAPEKYWEGITIIPPIVLSNYVVFIYTLYVNIEHYHEKTSHITLNTLIAAGTNLILNYIFIPKYGYVIAAYTTLVSYFLAFVLHARYAKKLENAVYPLSTFGVPLLQIAMAVVIFHAFISQWYLRWGLLMTYLFCMLIKERYRIMFFFPSIKTWFEHK